MKKKLFLFYFMMIVQLVLASTSFASDKKIISNKNEFGGQTIEYTVLPTESDYEQFYKVVWYGDASGNEKIIEYQLSSKVQEECGYAIQQEIYEEGCLVEYRMTLTKDESKKKGIKSISEKLDYSGNVSKVGYSNGKWSVYTESSSFANKYDAWSLPYIRKQCSLENPKSKDNNIFYYSEQYNAGRSFVSVVSNFEDLDDNDRMTINHYALCVDRPEIVNYFVGKVTVKSEGQKYTVFIHEDLVPFIKKGLNCFLTYGLVGRNDKLYLLSMKIDELDN